MTTDGNLLFGLLALQVGLIDQGKLVAAFQAWTLDKARSLADHMIARRDLDADDRAAVDALVKRHLKKHQGDVEKSLAAIPAVRSVSASLAGLGDPEIEQSLCQADIRSTQLDEDDATACDADSDRTATYSVGSGSKGGERFRILRPHARGGLGEVFVALDNELDREVALKQILDSHADDPISRQRFLLEARVTGGLEHPGIVPVYGLGTHAGGRPFYAMRFIRGESLKAAIDAYHRPADARFPSPPRPFGERSPQDVGGEGDREGARRAGEGVGENLGERRPLTPDPSPPGERGTGARTQPRSRFANCCGASSMSATPSITPIAEASFTATSSRAT